MKSLNVVIVDDDADVLAALTATLEDRYEVTGARGWRDLLRILRQGPLPDVVLLDIMMPEFNGFELLAVLKCRPTRAHIPVVVITALGDEGKRKALEYGASAYLTKPLDYGLLIDTIEQVTQAPSRRTPVFDLRPLAV